MQVSSGAMACPLPQVTFLAVTYPAVTLLTIALARGIDWRSAALARQQWLPTHIANECACLILVDDLGWKDLGCYGSDILSKHQTLIASPSEGMRFTDGYAACNVCSPTRVLRS